MSRVTLTTRAQRSLAALGDALPRLPTLSWRRRGDEGIGSGFERRPSLLEVLTLRPYGRSMLTPAAGIWLGSAWLIILLMASIEGFVWGAVGASLVPSASAALRWPVAVFMFLLLFCIVWIVDASLIMSERPESRRRRALDDDSVNPVARWYIGIVVRIAIVGISLYVTAPFIEKLIRADDIASWHQTQVERYYETREATLRKQIKERAEQRDAGLLGRVDALERDIERIEASLAAERERRAAIEAEFTPQLDVLTRDLADARQRVGDEVLGREGRPEGYGPEARKWDARAQLLEAQLADIQSQRDARLSGIEAGIVELSNRLGERTDALQDVRREQAALVAEITREVEAEQPPALPPKLTFAARSKALSALRNSPAEAGVPHFETVEGFAQAALGILFFALLALKLFEPPAVHAYFSEAVQLAYRRYLDGGLAHLPGFDQHQDPARRLAPVGFAGLWEQWQRDPHGFAARQQHVQSAESRLRRLGADIDYESELLDRRRDDIDARLVLERRRQEAELRALEQQLDLELAEHQRRLSEETDAELERLTQQREQARKSHELALAELDQRFATERARLDDELAQRRAAWQREQAEAEAELEQRKRAVESAERQQREQVRLKQLALDDRRRLRERALEHRSAAERAERDVASRELRIRETRALLEQEREAEARLREQRGELLAKRSEHADRAAALAAELEQGVLRQSELSGRARELRTAISDMGSTDAGGLPFGGGEDGRRRRRVDKELKQLDRAMEQLQLRRGRLAVERAGADQATSELDASIDALDRDIGDAGSRVGRYRDTLDRLLLARGST